MTLLRDASARTDQPALAAIAHGTSSAAGQRAVAGLVREVARRRDLLDVSGGFVDVQQPDVATTLASAAPGQPVAVVPLLLSAGYHVHVDLHNELGRTTDRRTALGRGLGPDDRLVSILIARLIEAGIGTSDHIVLACAGSSDARAVADCHEMGARLGHRLGRQVRVGFISAATPRLDDAVGASRDTGRGSRVVVSTYLLAPGFFNDLAHGTPADVVTEPLLRDGIPPPSELIDLVLDRFDEVAVGLTLVSGAKRHVE